MVTYIHFSARTGVPGLIPSDCPALCIFLVSPSLQRSCVEYATESIGVMHISMRADGADGVDGKFILLPFFPFGAPG